MFLVTRRMLIVLSVLLFVISFQSQAGFFEDMANKAKKAVTDTAKDVVNGNDVRQQQKQTQTQQSTYQKPTYDRKLVADIQGELNRVGYNVGIVDGAYGQGTARAIKKFQSDKGFMVDGIPSDLLLEKLKSQKNQQTSMGSGSISAYETGHPDDGFNVSVKLPDIDVVGIKLGLNAISSENHLISKGYKKKKVSENDMVSLGYYTRLNKKALPETKRIVEDSFTKETDTKRDQIILRYPVMPNKKQVYAISRSVTYKKFGPSSEKLRSALYKKYRPSTYSPNTRHVSMGKRTIHEWFYNHKGKQVPENIKSNEGNYQGNACGESNNLPYFWPKYPLVTSMASYKLFKVKWNVLKLGEDERNNKMVLNIDNRINVGRCGARLRVVIQEGNSGVRTIKTEYYSADYIKEASRNALKFMMDKYINKDIIKAENDIKGSDAPEL